MQFYQILPSPLQPARLLGIILKKQYLSNTITQDFSKNSNLKVEIKENLQRLTWLDLSGDMGNDYTGLSYTLYFIKDLFLNGLTLEP